MDAVVRRKQRNRHKFDSGSRNHSHHHVNDEKSLFQRLDAIAGIAKFCFLGLFLLIGVFVFIYHFQGYQNRMTVVTPFERFRPLHLKISPQTWGTLRSGHYLGFKAMRPNSPVAGLAWFTNSLRDITRSLPFRHWCSQSDKLSAYSWLKHDFRSFGYQVIKEKAYQIVSKVLFDLNKWSARVGFLPYSETHRQTNKPAPVSMIWYFAIDHEQDKLTVKSNDDNDKIQFGIETLGDTFLAELQIYSNNSLILYKGCYRGLSQPSLVNIKERLMENLYLVRHDLSNYDDFEEEDDDGEEEPLLQLKENKNIPQAPNFIACQLIAYPPFEVQIDFKSAESAETTHNQRKEDFDATYEKRLSSFDHRFEEVFQFKSKRFTDDQIVFAKAALSNLLGGIGYFYGSSLVQSKFNPEPVRYGPLQLLTAVPSRSFFPRGFLWDEGFHHLLISQFDSNLTHIIVDSWLNLMNIQGWIPREVILGAEAEARVPKEFIVQNSSNANPPTLFLTLESMLEAKTLNKDFVQVVFPRLEAWFNWYNTSQTGKLAGSYRWRGRNPHAITELNPKTLTSGLDDYPRATHPSDDERHLDLRCWITFASSVMHRLAAFIDHPSKAKYYNTEMYLRDENLLDRLHWSEHYQMYCDYGLNSKNVVLVRQNKQISPNHQPEEIFVRQVLSNPTFDCAPEFGYVSLFPLLLKLLPSSSSKLDVLLTAVRNETLIWSSFGLRSLSTTSRYYNTYNTKSDPPYWRSTIWINVNYLTLRALNHYASVPGPYKKKAKEIYTELRSNLITNMYRQWSLTGYIWEQYDDITGLGKGSHPFTGWSSLIVLIMSERY